MDVFGGGSEMRRARRPLESTTRSALGEEQCDRELTSSLVVTASFWTSDSYASVSSLANFDSARKDSARSELDCLSASQTCSAVRKRQSRYQRD